MASIEYHKKIKDMYGVPDVRVKEPQRLLLTAISRVTAFINQEWKKKGYSLSENGCHLTMSHGRWLK